MLMNISNRNVCDFFSQVTSKRINFIVDENMSGSYIDDAASTSGQYDQQDKDRSWLLSSLHQIYSRR
jgi:hypothetical protein